MSRSDELRRSANSCCEYCQLPEACAETPFQIDHIIAEQHGGLTVADNLAWSCYYCNKYKGPNIGGLDPATGSLTRLFNPRIDVWTERFRWDVAWLEGLTPEGRTTIGVLKLNRPKLVQRRQTLIRMGEFPAMTR